MTQGIFTKRTYQSNRHWSYSSKPTVKESERLEEVSGHLPADYIIVPHNNLYLVRNTRKERVMKVCQTLVEAKAFIGDLNEQSLRLLRSEE